MPLVETRTGAHLPVRQVADLDWTCPTCRPQVKHCRNRSAYDRTLYVGRASPLGNPFRPRGGESGRADAIRTYRVWLWSRLKAHDVKVLAELDRIQADTVLLCHCAPRDCHADVVSKAWVWLQRARQAGRYPKSGTTWTAPTARPTRPTDLPPSPRTVQETARQEAARLHWNTEQHMALV